MQMKIEQGVATPCCPPQLLEILNPLLLPPVALQYFREPKSLLI